MSKAKVEKVIVVNGRQKVVVTYGVKRYTIIRINNQLVMEGMEIMTKIRRWDGPMERGIPSPVRKAVEEYSASTQKARLI